MPVVKSFIRTEPTCATIGFDAFGATAASWDHSYVTKAIEVSMCKLLLIRLAD